MQQLEQEQIDSDWRIYTGSGNPTECAAKSIPEPPPWRRFAGVKPYQNTVDAPDASGFVIEPDVRGSTYQPEPETIDLVNAAIYLGRPLLITGKPGTGKSSLAYSIAHELRLGPVLRWNITSRSTLREGLYEYDALRRLADYNMNNSHPIGDYFTLGPLGTALLPWKRPRVLLIDEVDKGDMDLPNDLLNIFEEGEYTLKEIVGGSRNGNPEAKAQDLIVAWTSDSGQPPIRLPGATVRGNRFPIVILTSNGERDFPAPFLRRCLRLRIAPPDEPQLRSILTAHFKEIDASFVENNPACRTLIDEFLQIAATGDVATDQLLNAVYMTVGKEAPLKLGETNEAKRLRAALMTHLQSGAESATGSDRARQNK